MNLIIQSTLYTLNKSKVLLTQLNDDELIDASIAPYYSTIGKHIRHILDFYACIFAMDENRTIDLTARNRDKNAETNCEAAMDYLESIIAKLSFYKENLNLQIIVRDDLGVGSVDIPYTLAALLSQANSHTIHHYAIINYILEGLTIKFSHGDFGYNPTTPKKEAFS